MLLYGRWVPRTPFRRPGSPWLYASARDTRTGRVHTVSTRTTKAREASKVLSQYIDELQARETGAVVPDVRLGQAVEEYLNLKADLREVSLRALRYDFARYVEALGGQDARIAEVQHADLERWYHNLQGQPRTREKALVALRGFFLWAVRRRYVAQDPTEGLRAPKVPRFQGKALDREAARELLETAGDLRLAALLALHAGLRKGTISGLRWRDVNFEGKALELPAEIMKGKQPATLPIHPELLEALQAAVRRQPVNAEALVVGRLPDQIGGHGWHDLRRTFATWYGLRVTHAVLQALMAHAPGDVTDLYPKVSLEELRQAVEGAPRIAEESKRIAVTA